MIGNKNKKVIVAMSGGVDSSVSAALLQHEGYAVEGLFMKNWEEDDNKDYCAAAIDLADARSVCDKLGIFLHTANFSNEYWENVFKLFLKEYKLGKTPNPDVLCNKEIKFKVFLKFAIDHLDADFIATGHYVRSLNYHNNSYLLRGIDENKDQSYFLYMLNQKQIRQCLFPIGSLSKLKVRSIAFNLGLVNAFKKSSVGICFIGKKKFSNFISRYISNNPGNIIDVSTNKIVGTHQGLIYYTIGQRKGLRIGGISDNNLKKPWYVIDKDVKKNYLFVAQGRKNSKLMSISLSIKQIYWINNRPLKIPLNCTVKTRYRQADINCQIRPLLNNSSRYFQVVFDSPVAAITPGQSAVFYLSERCIGGGIIESRRSLNI